MEYLEKLPSSYEIHEQIFSSCISVYAFAYILSWCAITCIRVLFFWATALSSIFSCDNLYCSSIFIYVTFLYYFDFSLFVVCFARSCSISHWCATLEGSWCWWGCYAEWTLWDFGSNFTVSCKFSFLFLFLGIPYVHFVFWLGNNSTWCRLIGVKMHNTCLGWTWIKWRNSSCWCY